MVIPEKLPASLQGTQGDPEWDERRWGGAWETKTKPEGGKGAGETEAADAL